FCFYFFSPLESFRCHSSLSPYSLSHFSFLSSSGGAVIHQFVPLTFKPHKHTHARTHARTHHPHTHTHQLAHTHTHPHTHTHTPTHTHTHTHTHRLMCIFYSIRQEESVPYNSIINHTHRHKHTHALTYTHTHTHTHTQRHTLQYTHIIHPPSLSLSLFHTALSL